MKAVFTSIVMFFYALPVLANPVIDGDYLYVLDMGGKLVKLSLDKL